MAVTAAKKPAYAGRDGAMREAMPTVTAFLDEMRATFGDAPMRQAIRRGIEDGSFMAFEGSTGWKHGEVEVVSGEYCLWPRGVQLCDLVLGKPKLKRAER